MQMKHALLHQAAQQRHKCEAALARCTVPSEHKILCSTIFRFTADVSHLLQSCTTPPLWQGYLSFFPEQKTATVQSYSSLFPHFLWIHLKGL